MYVLRRTPKRTCRVDGKKSAEALIRTLGYDDLVVLTSGQFGALDIIRATLDVRGPTDVDITTWTVGPNDADVLIGLVDSGRITRLRLLLDGSLRGRQEAVFSLLTNALGPDAIRTMGTHAKLARVGDVVITTSANLSKNTRMELFSITRDAEFAEWCKQTFDTLFDELPTNTAYQGRAQFGKQNATKVRMGHASTSH